MAHTSSSPPKLPDLLVTPARPANKRPPNRKVTPGPHTVHDLAEQLRDRRRAVEDNGTQPVSTVRAIAATPQVSTTSAEQTRAVTPGPRRHGWEAETLSGTSATPATTKVSVKPAAYDSELQRTVWLRRETSPASGLNSAHHLLQIRQQTNQRMADARAVLQDHAVSPPPAAGNTTLGRSPGLFRPTPPPTASRLDLARSARARLAQVAPLWPANLPPLPPPPPLFTDAYFVPDVDYTHAQHAGGPVRLAEFRAGAAHLPSRRGLIP